MVPLSNCLFVLFNLVAMISGCIAIGSSLYFNSQGISECPIMFENPLMVMGTIFVFLSVIGLMGSICKITSALWFYSFVAFLCILGLTAFPIYAYVVNSPGSSRSLVGVAFKKQRNYTQWLTIRACLIDQHVCRNLDYKSIRGNLSPIESGCCMPPTQCRFYNKNITMWIAPESGPAVKDQDCYRWSNDQDKLCYDCDTCKSGVVEMSRLAWTIFAILDAIDIVIILTAFGLSCSARRNILSDKKHSKGYRL